jgi:hypothetical protein
MDVNWFIRIPNPALMLRKKTGKIERTKKLKGIILFRRTFIGKVGFACRNKKKKNIRMKMGTGT